MRSAHSLLIVPALLFANPLHAQPVPSTPDSKKSTEGEDKLTFKVEPVLLDSDASSGATLGVQYALHGDIFAYQFAKSDSGSKNIDQDTTMGSFNMKISARGTVATAADRNPKNLIESELKLGGQLYGSMGQFFFSALAKYETDQKFENRQWVFGGQLTWVKRDLFFKNDSFAIDASYGKVDPGKDKERMAALNVTTLDGYDRFQGEALYIASTGWNIIDTVELNYRIYKEIKAPAAIKSAKLDKFEVASIRVGLPRQFFVAYRVGKLPFDRSTDYVLEAGWSFKLF